MIHSTDFMTIITSSVLVALITIPPTYWFIYCISHKMAYKKAEEEYKFNPFPLTMVFSLLTLVAFSISLSNVKIGSMFLILVFAAFSIFHMFVSEVLGATDFKKNQTVLNVMYSVAYIECLICMVHMLWVFF